MNACCYTDNFASRLIVSKESDMGKLQELIIFETTSAFNIKFSVFPRKHKYKHG